MNLDFLFCTFFPELRCQNFVCPKPKKMEINETSENAHAKDCIAKFFDAVADVEDSATENVGNFLLLGDGWMDGFTCGYLLEH